MPTPTLATPVRSGEDPSVPGEGPPPGLLPQRDGRKLDVLVQVAPHGEPPQHPGLLDQPGALGHVAGGSVGPDDEVGPELASPPTPNPSRDEPDPSGRSARPSQGTAPASMAAARRAASKTTRVTARARPGIGRRRRSRGGRPAVRSGPPPPCRRRRDRGARGRPRSARTWRPLGPMKSPQALSRGNGALSSRATWAPARARTSAAMLPAGPAPTTSTSKRLELTPLLPGVDRLR